jgi:methyl-accepting chemotaxis protein
MSETTARIAEDSQQLARDAEEQADGGNAVSSSLEDMGSMTRRNLDASQALAQLAAEARSSAEVGARQVETLKDTMREVQSAGADVVKINRLIDEIAFQTNILALNAAVEAARAGEAGLGFAVVADEVRNLARRCAEAAQETSDKIRKSMSAGEQGAAATVALAEKLGRIAGNTRKLDEHVQSIAEGSSEQNRIVRITNAAGVMTRGTRSNAVNAAEGAERARQFNAQARALAAVATEISEMFRRSDRAPKGPVQQLPASASAPVSGGERISGPIP